MRSPLGGTILLSIPVLRESRVLEEGDSQCGNCYDRGSIEAQERGPLIQEGSRRKCHGTDEG